MYADPLSGPLISFLSAPTATVSPLIATLKPSLSSNTPLEANSLAHCVHLAVGLSATSRLKMYADPLPATLPLLP
jgi:hypothetical protein